MLRILSSKRYWSLISKISEQRNEIQDLQMEIKNLKESLEYVNQKNFDRTHEIMRLRSLLNKNGICWSESGIDFPATSKILNSEDINRILKL